MPVLSRSRTFQVHRSRSVWLHGGGREDAQKSVGEATYNPFADLESDDEQKVSEAADRRTRSFDMTPSGARLPDAGTSHRRPAVYCTDLTVAIGFGTMPKSSFSCCLLFITICPLVSMVMCWASVLYRACQSITSCRLFSFCSGVSATPSGHFPSSTAVARR